MAVDDSFTVSLLHFNGADASTTFTDESGKTWTANGNAQLDTAQFKFGTASLLLDGTGDYITTPDSADFDFGTGDFTIDLQARWNTLPTSGNIQTIYCHGQDANNYTRFGIYNNAGTYQVLFYIVTSGSAVLNLTKNFASAPSTGVWYHFALVRTGNDWKAFQGGSQCGTTLTQSTTYPNLTGLVGLGDDIATGAHFYFNGWMDEVRVSKGIARWTTTFTPPTSQYGLGISTDVGSYTYTGQTTNTLAGRLVAVAYATYSYTGQTIALVLAKAITATYGIYTYTGNSALLTLLRFFASVYLKSENTIRSVIGQDTLRTILSTDTSRKVRE